MIHGILNHRLVCSAHRGYLRSDRVTAKEAQLERGIESETSADKFTGAKFHIPLIFCFMLLSLPLPHFIASYLSFVSLSWLLIATKDLEQ